MSKSKRKTELLARAYFVLVLFVVIAIVITFRVIKISVFEGEKWRSKGEVNVRWMKVDTDRGNIYSDDESLLATSLQLFEIRMDMLASKEEVFWKNIDSLSNVLSTTIRKDKSSAEWRKALVDARKKKNRYFFIAKGLDIGTVKEVRKFPFFRLGRFASGYMEIRYGKRVKPFKELASRTIGEDRENAQKVGIEGYFDKFLAGPVDERLMKRISATDNIWIPVYDPSEVEVKRGDDVITTLNVNLQDIVHTELEKAILKWDAKMGVAILMEVETGAIKAISNLSNRNGLVKEELNVGISHATEPGSTFKLATLLALLEDKKIDLNSKVVLNGGVKKFYNRTMYDSERHGKYETTVREAFAISSNVGIASLANTYYNASLEGRKQFRQRLVEFGLNSLTGIEIDGEGSPKIKDPVADKSQWYGTTIPWMAHGYEIAITPLQLLNFYNAVANGGNLMKPYLVSEIRHGNKIVKEFKPKVLKKIASDPSIRMAREALEEVVKTGTASALKTDKFSFAGKTGTTRVNYAIQEEAKKYNGSFVGYFPADKPKYSMIVVIYEPKGRFYGGTVAGPVFKAVAEKIMALYDTNELIAEISEAYNQNRSVMLPEASSGYARDFKVLFEHSRIDFEAAESKKWVYVEPTASKMSIKPNRISKKAVPDVRGMGARDATYVLENLGLKVSVHGAGKVMRQDIPPGTRANGQKIEVYLN